MDKTFRTLDGVEITDGLRVWDYNMNRVLVSLDGRQWEENGKLWFDCRNEWTGMLASLMSNDRVWVRHPSTGEWA
jgi:hypothetical protein